MQTGSPKPNGKPPVLPSPMSVTPVITWRTPWRADRCPPRSRPPGSHSALPLARRSRPGQQLAMREQERLMHGQEQRRLSLELLEARSSNRTLIEQVRQEQRAFTELKLEREALHRANALLREELKEAKDSLKHARYERKKMSEGLRKRAGLLSDEKELRRAAEDDLARCQAALARRQPKPRAISWGDRVREINDTNNSSRCFDSSSSAAEDAGLLLPDLADQVASCLSGTVSSWVKGMQSACTPAIKRLILPWLLHKLFYLCSALVDDRREELVTLFSGGAVEVDEGGQPRMDAHTAEFMHRHLCRHHLTLFPLSGDSLKTAVDKVVLALAYSMVDSKEWDPTAKDPDAVHRTLAASGLETIVREYLHIMVCCCLQRPFVNFSDDLGNVERHDAGLHSDPIDGQLVTEWCVVVFPAVVVSQDADEWGGQPQTLTRRFVLQATRE